MVSGEPVPPRLLIVDPRAILHLEYAACTVAVGFDVEQADNTEQGLAKAMLLVPDIVLTDCSADTGGVGVEFCRRLKARVTTSRIPVLGLIGGGDPLHATAAVVAGCTVLAKPCSPERLLVEIVRVLGVWPPGPAAVGSTTVDQLTLMLGRVLRVNAQLMEQNDSLSGAAHLWATWYERTLKRANEASVDGRPSDWSLRERGQETRGDGCDARATAPRSRGRR
jgi:DNA-binding response OmpR family regulator